MDGTRQFEEKLARIYQAIGSNRQSDLARILEIKAPSVAAACKRKQIPGGWVESIAEKCGISADWLLFGDEGARTREAGAHETRTREAGTREAGAHEAGTREARTYGAGVREARTHGTRTHGAGESAGGAASQAQSGAGGPEVVAFADHEIIMIPMVEARLSAGHGSFETSAASERKYSFRSDFLRRKGNISEMVLMRVDGDSMSPEVKDGDVVLIDRSQTAARAGCMYAVGVEDVVYLKILNTLPGRIILSSHNPEYAPFEIDTRGDLENSVRIIGRVIWSCREW